jgi:hypothetical protein
VKEKVEELKEYPGRALILPKHFEVACQGNVDVERLFITLAFVVPFRERLVHPDSVRHPICDYIRERYRLEQEPTARSFWFGLWVPKT